MEGWVVSLWLAEDRTTELNEVQTDHKRSRTKCNERQVQ